MCFVMVGWKVQNTSLILAGLIRDIYFLALTLVSNER